MPSKGLKCQSVKQFVAKGGSSLKSIEDETLYTNHHSFFLSAFGFHIMDQGMICLPHKFVVVSEISADTNNNVFFHKDSRGYSSFKIPCLMQMTFFHQKDFCCYFYHKVSK